MTNEEKQALIEHIETDLELWRNVTLKYCHECEQDDVLRDIKVNEIALAALTAQPVISDDTKRMDWLVSKTVNVREPLRYGSRDLFWSEAVTDEEDDHATLLREQIDAAVANEVQE